MLLKFDKEAERLLYVMEVEAKRRLEHHIGMLKYELEVRNTLPSGRPSELCSSHLKHIQKMVEED